MPRQPKEQSDPVSLIAGPSDVPPPAQPAEIVIKDVPERQRAPKDPQPVVSVDKNGTITIK